MSWIFLNGETEKKNFLSIIVGLGDKNVVVITN